MLPSHHGIQRLSRRPGPTSSLAVRSYGSDAGGHQGVGCRAVQVDPAQQRSFRVHPGQEGRGQSRSGCRRCRAEASPGLPVGWIHHRPFGEGDATVHNPGARHGESKRHASSVAVPMAVGRNVSQIAIQRRAASRDGEEHGG